MSSGDQQLDNQQQDAWEACPAGELTQMVGRLEAAQRRARSKQVVATALASTAVFACLVFAVGSMLGRDLTPYGGISCAFCRDHFAEYAPHVAGERVHQDAEFVTSMEIHLAKCSFCRDAFNAIYPDMGTTDGSSSHLVAKPVHFPLFAISERAPWY